MKTFKIGLLAGALVGLGQAVQATCPVDGATPFTAGPVDPVNGFATYLQDSEGLALELCLDGTGTPTGTPPDVCFFDPPIAGNAISELIGFGPEGFYWLASPVFGGPNSPPQPLGLPEAVLVLGAEAAWVAEIPGPGEQFPFTRLRIRLGVQSAGYYRVTHPYGQEVYHIPNPIGGGGGRDVNDSFDIQFQPDAVNQGRVGPWLSWDPAVPPAAPAGYIGDGATAHPVIGSPCGTNYFKIEAFSDAALTVPVPIELGDPGGDGSNVVQVNDFTVVGKLFTGGPLPTPLVVDQTTYSRANDGRVNVFATAPTTASLSFSGAANIPAGPQAMAGDGGKYFGSVALDPDAGTLPASVQVTATNATNPNNDPNTVNSDLVDVVTITRAEYVKATGALTVEASSSDRSPTSPPTLTATGLGTLVDGALSTSATVAPATVTVTSSAGGSDTQPVTIINPVP
jgi:hypothetical protein